MNPQAEAVAGKVDFSINRSGLLERFKSVRKFTEILCEPLITEDYVIQTMPDVSPAKWHLAHVTWFFETFVLMKYESNYKQLNETFGYLFNSYYVLAGERYTRANRGFISRPSVKEVYDYRKYVDEQILNFLSGCTDEIFNSAAGILEIGLNHEQQHQELLLTDLKYNFSHNPLHPVYIDKQPKLIDAAPGNEWINFEGGLINIGHADKTFSYDNETPAHKVFIQPFALSSRLITNKEYIEFINDGGYKREELWLSSGFAFIEENKISAPLYWKKKGGDWWTFSLTGFHRVMPDEPVCHISHYEADAFARWKDARLPTEFEWEHAAADVPVEGNFVDKGNFHPVPLSNAVKNKLNQMYGDVWEWTSSAYLPYHGYKPAEGAIGEYNGKFMSGQMVLKGGSCATSKTHIRKTYRNFFPPDARWQFTGIRLAKDL